MIELYLIRHGNAAKRAGESYVTAPLTELGRKQAELTGEYLQRAQVHFVGLYCSPLKRAVETAELVGKHIGQTAEVRAGLQEMEYREIPQTVFMELLARTGVLNRYFEQSIGKPMRFPMIGRLSHAVHEMLGQHQEDKMCIVAHGGVVSGVLAWYFPRERRKWWGHTVGNCSITRLEIDGQRALLLGYDEVKHLESLGESAHERNYTFSGESRV